MVMNKLLRLFLVLLGFSACSSDDDNSGSPTNPNEEQPCEYGTPTYTYQIKGKVTDLTNTPIDSVKVKMMTGQFCIDSTMTDTIGSYQISEEHTQLYPEMKTVYEKKGYQSDTLDADFSAEEFKDGDAKWFNGSASKEINAQLKKN